MSASNTQFTSLARDRNAQRIECVVLTATWPEAIAEAEEVLLVDALKHPQHRLLDDLVLQGERCPAVADDRQAWESTRDERALPGSLRGEYDHEGQQY